VQASFELPACSAM